MRRSHFALSVTSLAAALVAPPAATRAIAEDGWTVLTMASDGSWGAATSFTFSRAIAIAIANCKIAYQREIGCGASFTSIQSGWSLGIQCGRQTIVVAEKTLAGVEQAAARREAELRQHYGLDMPACRRVVAVDPNGTIIAPHPDDRDADRIVGR
jgi:hypothetical protein